MFPRGYTDAAPVPVVAVHLHQRADVAWPARCTTTTPVISP